MFISSRCATWFIFIFYFSIWNRSAWAQNNTDYCNVASCKTKVHTVCTYSKSGPSSNCYNPILTSLTVNETSRLVKRHNELRKQIADGKEMRGAPGPQPPASNMKEMKWDTELAEIAQRWADQCISGHDSCRDSGRFVVGQNIATQWNSNEITVTLEELVGRWYDEVELFDPKIVAKYQFDSNTGHYTQLVWANTSFLGCGVVRYFDNRMNMNAMKLICNYGPAGNYIGQPMYKEGNAASACSSGVSKSIASLCI